ncbi:MAG: hypothetical protein HKN43_03740 [Rhodothermales bacterium]|nr:hypothetical protein [Rhodothermales bacterium]
MTRLDNIDRLFAAVQLLLPDDTDSGKLFKEAFDGSLPDYEVTGDSDRLRRSFYAKLISILQHATPPDGQAPAEVQSDLKYRIHRKLFDEAFPYAFVQLKPGEQLLLFLTSVEGYEPDSIAEITGFETDHATRQIETVFHKLENIIAGSAVRLESIQTEAGVPRTWITDNLKTFSSSYLEKTPDTIHRFVESRFSPGERPVTAPSISAARREKKAVAKNGKALKLVATVFTIFFTGLAAIVAAQYFAVPEPTTPSVYELSVEKASNVRPVLPTTDAAQAEQFILTHFGRVIMVPALRSATLAGIGSSEVMSGRRVPTIIYEDAGSDESIVVFGYSYAILKELSAVTLVGESLLRSLEEPAVPIIETIRGHPVVVWRVADDILFAVLPEGHENPGGIL